MKLRLFVFLALVGAVLVGLLKPDSANAGKVVKATGFSDGPIVGYGRTAQAAGFISSRINL